MEFLKIFTFFIKHTSGKSNKDVDELSIINLNFHGFQISTLGFDEMNDVYKEVVDFEDAYATCKNLKLFLN